MDSANRFYLETWAREETGGSKRMEPQTKESLRYWVDNI